MIRRINADVVGVQEARPNQLAFLRRSFGNAELVGRGRDADGGGEHAAVLVRPPWSVDREQTRWLSREPDVPGSIGWDAKLPRVATLVEIHRGQFRLLVVNTHLDHQGGRSRVQAARLLAQWVSDWVAENRLPAIVLGDLNQVPGSKVTNVLLEAGLVDALPADAGGTEHAFTGAWDRKRIDHIFATPSLTVRSGWVDHGPYPDPKRWDVPSDHWPVVADLDLTPTPHT